MTPREVLIAARELISVPERWTQGAGSRNAAGVPVSSRSSDACSWCADHAVWVSAGCKPREMSGAPYVLYEEAMDALRAATGERLVHKWNDDAGTAHADVLAAFDRAIAAAGEP